MFLLVINFKVDYWHSSKGLWILVFEEAIGDTVMVAQFQFAVMEKLTWE